MRVVGRRRGGGVVRGGLVEAGEGDGWEGYDT